MDSRVLRVLFFGFCLCGTARGKAIHPSGNLDFGDSPHSHKKIPVKAVRTEDSIISPSETVSVLCGSTGCNTTKSASNNSVETEVVVRVKTNVNLDKSQNKKDNVDVSDVPVVVGYRGATLDETPGDEQLRSYSPVTPDGLDVYSRRDDTAFSEPFHSNSPTAIEAGYGRHGVISENPYYQFPDYRSKIHGYPGSALSPSPPLVYHGPSSTSRTPGSYYYPSTSRSTLGINGIASRVSVTVPELTRSNSNNIRDNGLEPHIPYFQHAFNMHYFGEEPPPHFLALSKTPVINPVEFRNVPKNKWRPSTWNGRTNKYAFSNGGSNFINPHTHNQSPPIPSYSQSYNHRGQGETVCSCKEHRNEDSNSYGAESVHHVAVQSKDREERKDPGVSIDDKLAPFS